MTICHQKELDGEFTDEQLVEHLQSSDCAECRDAGFRMAALLKQVEELQDSNLEARVAAQELRR
ncbi:hypothetical protein [Ralstonia phage RP31]|uniref:Uncharacterized protein n=2 Tax=Ripduovirus RP12 TaxID=2560700 RepID=A0A1L7N0V0_9CAUD|nr:hypothetical protein FDH28_gp129 [Ralstonia phage RP12]BAW19103.1 hypothetical protein [Ralstonia phage RP12]BAW19389.1 hypothetical protein [Ralstonia phage RP31]